MSHNTFLYPYFPFFFDMQSNPIDKKRHVLYSIKYIWQSVPHLVLSVISFFMGMFCFYGVISSYISGTLLSLWGTMIISLIIGLVTGIILVVTGLIVWPRFPRVLILYKNRMEFTNSRSSFIFQNHPIKKVSYCDIEKIDIDSFSRAFLVHLKGEYDPIVFILVGGIPIEKVQKIIDILGKKGIQFNFLSNN